MEEIKYYENLDQVGEYEDADDAEEDRLRKKEESAINAKRKKLYDMAPLRHKMRIKFNKRRVFRDPFTKDVFEQELESRPPDYFEPPPFKPKLAFYE